MTDTTDKAALREFLMEQIDHADSYGGKVWLCAEDARLAMSSLDQLEAERQRADRYHFVAMSALESQAEISEQLGISEDECDGSPEQIHEKIEMLQTELAALKGDQVPVGYIQDHQLAALMGGNTTVVKPNSAFGETVELFAAPQKPVVLPKSFSQSDYLSHGLEPSDAYGLSYGSSEMRALCKKAIEATGGKVAK